MTNVELDEKLTSTPVQIIELMQVNPKITVTQLAQKLQLSRTAIDNNIQKLKQWNHLTRIGSAKGGHWKVSPRNST